MTYSVLTAAQGAILRNRIGDTQSTPVLSDTVLDACYTAASSDLDIATVEALQQLVGYYAMQVTQTGNQEFTEDRNARYEHLKELLAYWEQKTGRSGSALQVGQIDLNIDTDYDDLGIT